MCIRDSAYLLLIIDSLKRGNFDDAYDQVNRVTNFFNEENHKQMLISREKYTWRNAERYLSSFKTIRKIQNGILEIGKPLNWKTIDLSTGINAVNEIAHFFMLAGMATRKERICGVYFSL